MTSKPVYYPGLLSVPRFTTLLVSLLVTLSSGTSYVYSAYAPQLGSRLHISHTQLNILGLAGNIGGYGSGPLFGRTVDLYGPRILLASAFVLLLAGYSVLGYIFDSGLPATSKTISTLTFCFLILCRIMTGAGGNAGLTSAVNATSKTFPDRARGAATGIVISGFGLSAFLFSTIARNRFAGNTSSFLRLLSLGTAIPMIVGFFFIRPIPLPPLETPEEGRRSLMTAEEEAGEESPLLETSAAPTTLSKNVHGRELWTSSDFWLLFTIFSMLGGTGLTFINNVGSISQALYTKSVNVYDPTDAARWQADQVSSISILNFFGRIFIGLVSDFAKNRLHFPRSYSLVLVAFLFLLSQVLAAFVIDDIKHLWIVSATLGLAHGSAFSLFPNVCLEWFGMPHFSENWGYVTASPVIAGNIFSFVFGHILDAHESFNVSPKTKVALTSSVMSATTTATATATGTCTLGRECYVFAVYLTTGACFVSTLLSLWAGWRDKKRLAAGVRMAPA